jgi:hypothetical protein
VGRALVTPVRDGTWLQNGITQRQRCSAHQNLSDKEVNDATLVTSCIGAVVDLEKERVQRAALLSKPRRSLSDKFHITLLCALGPSQ